MPHSPENSFWPSCGNLRVGEGLLSPASLSGLPPLHDLKNFDQVSRHVDHHDVWSQVCLDCELVQFVDVVRARCPCVWNIENPTSNRYRHQSPYSTWTRHTAQMLRCYRASLHRGEFLDAPFLTSAKSSPPATYEGRHHSSPGIAQFQSIAGYPVLCGYF